MDQHDNYGRTLAQLVQSARVQLLKLSWCVAAVAAALFMQAGLSGSTCAAENPQIEVIAQVGHQSIVTGVSFSPDGRQTLTSSYDGSVKLWDVATQKLIRTFVGQLDWIHSVAYSPDGKRFVTGRNDGVVTIWNIATGGIVQTIQAHSQSVRAVAFSPDGQFVMSGSDDQTLKLWRVLQSKAVQTFKGHGSWINSVRFSPDGKMALSAAHDGTAALWTVATGKRIRFLEGHQYGVWSADFSPDGTRVLTGSADKTLKLWNASNGKVLRTFSGHSAEVDSVAFSPDGKRAVSGGRDKTVKIWDLAADDAVQTFDGFSSDVKGVAFSPLGTHVAAAEYNKVTSLWELQSGTLLGRMEGETSVAVVAKFSTNGATILAGGRDDIPRLWDASTGSLLSTFIGHTEDVLAAALVPDGSKAFTGGFDDVIRIWDTATGKPVDVIDGKLNGIRSLAVSSDGKQLLSGDNGGSISLWDAATGDPISTIADKNYSITSAAFSPDNTQVLSAGHGPGNAPKLWDIASGDLLQTFTGHSKGVIDAAFLGEGFSIVTASFDGTVKVWATATGEPLKSWTAHGGSVSAMAVSPNGDFIASSGDDGKLRLWSADTGDLAIEMLGNQGQIHSLSFTQDGRRLVSASADSTIRIWRVQDGARLATLIGSSGGSWLAITDAGFFAGSPGSESLINVVRGLEPYSVIQFRDHLYRPDLVEELLKGDPEGKYKDAASKLNLQTVLDSGPAPELQRGEQMPDQAGGSVKLTVQINSTGGGIGEKLIWRVNGITQGDPSPAALKGLAEDPLASATVTQILTVDAGQSNRIEVTTYNGAGLLASHPLIFTVDKFGVTSTARPRMHVLAIGVDNYRMKGFELKYAAKDAGKFAEAMEAVGSELFTKVEVTSLLNEKVTRDNIEAAFKTIGGTAKPGDVFVLFLGGHGKSVEGRYYYYPQTLDFAAGQSYLDAIGQDQWQMWLAKIPAQKTLLVLDTCESGAAGGLIRGADSARQTAMDQLQHATGHNLIAAAGSAQAAIEGYKGHGVLTYALLDALSQKEGQNPAEQVTVGALSEHAYKNVPKITQSVWGVYQNPIRSFSGNDFPIGLRAAVMPTGTDQNAVPTEFTHVVIRTERARKSAADDAESDLEPLTPGKKITLIKMTENGFALVARDGKVLGYVPADAIVKLE